MASQTSSLRALQNWCARQCASHPGVNVNDLTNSFRNGLAFCAIIHRYHPDLIDFYSLDPDDALENNRLAFSVAENSLGIPALLEAEDMVDMLVPDRLSVITYLSQYYHHFKDKIPFEDQNNEGSDDMLSYRRQQGSPPRYRLHDPSRYAMFKPSPPPRPLAAKKNNWSSSSIEYNSSGDRVASSYSGMDSSVTPSPSHTPTTPSFRYEINTDRSSTQEEGSSPEPGLQPRATATSLPGALREQHVSEHVSENSSLYTTPPATPPAQKRQPRKPPPRRRQKKDSWDTLISSGDSVQVVSPGVPKTPLDMISGEKVPSVEEKEQEKEELQKTSLSAMEPHTLARRTWPTVPQNGKTHNNGYNMGHRMDEDRTRQELQDMINSIHEPALALSPSRESSPPAALRSTARNSSGNYRPGEYRPPPRRSPTSPPSTSPTSTSRSSHATPTSPTRASRAAPSSPTRTSHAAPSSPTRASRAAPSSPSRASRASPTLSLPRVPEQNTGKRRSTNKNPIYSEQDVGKIMTRAYDPEGGSSRGNTCFICGSHVFILERTVARQRLFHRQCFVCNGCGTKLLLGMYEVYDGDSMFYCKSCFKKIKLREGCKSEEYREALGCPVTDPEELWSLPASQPRTRDEDERASQPRTHDDDERSLSPLDEVDESGQVRFELDAMSEEDESRERAASQDRAHLRSTSDSEDDLRARSLSCGASDPTYSSLELDNTQRKRRSILSMNHMPPITRLFSPILKRSKRNVFDYSSVEDIERALKEEEEMLMLKRQVHIDEMYENEHQQKQMEICGQGLEMKLRDQEHSRGFDDEALYDWFELVNRKNRLSHTESILVISIKEIDINLQQKVLERQLRDLQNVRKKYKERYIKSKEQELVKKLLGLVEERDNLINMEETQRISAMEMDKQFRDVMSATAGITV